MPELKSDLISSGFYFDVPSRVNNIDDSLVLIACFIKYGYDMVEKLNGAYSFAIWNENKNELFLVRDHFGIKPFHGLWLLKKDKIYFLQMYHQKLTCKTI